MPTPIGKPKETKPEETKLEAIEFKGERFAVVGELNQLLVPEKGCWFERGGAEKARGVIFW